MLKKVAISSAGLLLLVFPLVSGAQTTFSLQAQIDALLKQIAQLQAQITAMQGQLSVPTGDSSQCLNLKNSLVIGSEDKTTNGEVSRLQLWLKQQGYFLDAQGTGYYGEKTAAAVVRFQKAHGMDFVTTKSGVGPMTRAKLREVCLSTKIGDPAGGSYGLSAKMEMVGTLPVAIAEFHGGFDEGVVGVNAPKGYIDFGDGASRPIEHFVCPGDDCYYRARYLYSSPGTYTITLHTITNTKRVDLATTTLVVTQAACPNSDTPSIASISPTSGPKGTTIEVWGCNFSGFEGDKNFWIKNTAGTKALLHAETYGSDTPTRLTIPASACQTDTSYSGLDCPATLNITPGTYTLQASSYGGSSNAVTFIVTQ